MKKLTKCKAIIASLMLILLAGAALSGCGEGGTYATQKNFITIGCVCPLTGEKASYGEGTLETEEEAVRAINESGGVYIDTLERKLKVRFVVADSMSTAEGAKAAAKKLIEEDHVDVMISSSGALTTLPVAEVCEAEKMPFFSVNCENSAWIASGEHKYAFNCSYDNAARIAALNDIWTAEEMTSVGFLATPSAEADGFATLLKTSLQNSDIDVTDPGRLDISTGYFRRAMRYLSNNAVECVICYMSAADFSALWQEGSIKNIDCNMFVLIQDDFLPKETAEIAPAAEIKEFYTLASWDKSYPFTSSLTDEESALLGRFWEDHFLTPSSELTGFKHASCELAVDAVKLAMALDAESIVSAAESLNVDTVLGLVDFDDTNSSVIPCSVLHWTYDAPTASWSKTLISHTQLGDVEFDEDE